MLFNTLPIQDLPDEMLINSPLWEFKHNNEDLRKLKEGDIYTYNSQYQQNPSSIGGGIFKDNMFKTYEILPSDISTIRMYCDTASKTKDHNDYTVFECWGKSPSQGIFLIDLFRDKVEAPQLESKFVEFWTKHKPTQFKPLGLQMAKVEDKSSGTGLIQSIRQNYMIPIEGIQRNVDKFTRVMGVIKYFGAGYIHLPIDAPWVFDFKDEFLKFTPLMTHAHDDQIDPALDAVEDLLIFEDTLYNSLNV